MRQLLLVFVAIASGAITLTSADLQCIDDSGKPVDWYIIYKFPFISPIAQTKPIFGGYRYAVISSATPDGWRLSPYNISESQSVFARTLGQILPEAGNKKRDISGITSVFYNDQPPNTESTASSTYAHSKGILAADLKTGFWLIHTVPRLQPGNESFSYVSSGGRYGQVAMCISLDPAQLDLVVTRNFLTAKPYVYHTSIPHETTPLGQAVTKLKNKQWDTTHLYVETNLTSLGGVHFRSFYKSPRDLVDLYAGIVAPAVAGPLLVETWRRGTGNPLESACQLPKTRVENVAKIDVSFENSGETGYFVYTEDHSKWAISGDIIKSEQSLVCLGDVNRMESQFKRGGGTTCIGIPSVWKAFRGFVADIEECGSAEEEKAKAKVEIDVDVELTDALHGMKIQ